ncbi:MAG: PA2778 family cysteine peptidase [Gammaproteobacteria bacterium]|nr:PA2778 family cysteine peptidase [Gammaproteobacteria bacterium]
MSSIIKAGMVASFCLIIFGCANANHHIKQVTVNSAPYTIPNVPFYPQQTFYCGPTTLAEVANFHGAELTPEQIAPKIFIPNREGSLQLEMVAATRQLELLAYAKKNGDLDTLIELVNQDIPVIVLQNNGVSWLPQWHYSVVIGFDLPNEVIILHSGLDKNIHVNVGVFMNTWQRSSHWYLAALPADKELTKLDPFTYIKAAQELITTQQTEAGLAALNTAINMWPDNWLSYFLLANHYFVQEPDKSLHYFQAGIKNAPEAQQQTSFLNNYAYTLARTGCKTLALNAISQAIELAPADQNLKQSQNELKSYETDNQCQSLL